ncbi:hypothetical protein [Oricola indica]|uniref:hypothetical protein n=1 Tax=Oricola indica TaxID=2872591 RepID=UPI003CCC2596
MSIDQNEIESQKRNEALRHAQETQDYISRNREQQRRDGQKLEEAGRKAGQGWSSGRSSGGKTRRPKRPLDPGMLVGAVAAGGALWGSLEFFELAEWWYALIPAAIAGALGWKFWKPIVAIVLLAVVGAIAYGALGASQ